MKEWKNWEEKNHKYKEWHHEKPNKVFSSFWDAMEEKAIELMPLSTGNKDVLLDVGCGDGRYLNRGVRSKGYFGIGIDPNIDVSLHLAKNKVKEVANETFLMRCVGEFIPLQDSTVSIALCNSTLDHMIEPKAAMKEIYRVLKANGLLILWQGVNRTKKTKLETSEQETHLGFFTKDELVNLLTYAGFFIKERRLFGCSIIPISETTKSMSSRIPRFVNNYLPSFLRVYLLLGKLLPMYASSALFCASKNKEDKTKIRSSA